MSSRTRRPLALLLAALAAGAPACRADRPGAGSAGDTTAAAAAVPDLGRIVADSFTLVVHGAERFTPPPSSLWTPAPGHEYIALDVALHNTTADSIALGWRTITPALVDASGRRHPFLPSLVAAFEMEAPNRARFDAAAHERLIGGRLAAHESVRAWAWAFEVPRGQGVELEIGEGEGPRRRVRVEAEVTGSGEGRGSGRGSGSGPGSGSGSGSGPGSGSGSENPP